MQHANAIPAYRAMVNMVNIGEHTEPRGAPCREIRWYRDIIEYPFHSFRSRPRDNLDYIKREFQWYLHADQTDDRICEYAKIWNTVKQPTGEIFSNYGYYWFGPQGGFFNVCRTLFDDPSSRRAYIPMCNADHMFQGNMDVVCTKGITFRITHGKLHMHVSMRSSDLFIGASIDWPCFAFLHGMVASFLRTEIGDFLFSADSLHVYDNSWHHVEAIVSNNCNDMYEIEVPPITSVSDLLEEKYKSPFGKWLTEVKL